MFCSALSGCISNEEEDVDPFPSFNLVDEANNAHERSMYVGEPFVAYFSATWCTHCKPALAALDDTVPSGQVLIFNKDPNEEDMKEWKNKIDEVCYPSQLDELRKQTEELRLFKTKAVTIFMVIQFLMALAVFLEKFI